jgi:hypothetical protein
VCSGLAAANGDPIVLAAGVYRGAAASATWNASDLRIVGEGEVTLDAAGEPIANGKAIWVGRARPEHVDRECRFRQCPGARSQRRWMVADSNAMAHDHSITQELKYVDGFPTPLTQPLASEPRILAGALQQVAPR